jgi:phage-related protein
MADAEHKKQWRFYDTETGSKVARNELDALPAHGKAALAHVMKRYRVGETFPGEVKSVGRGIVELRASVGNNQYRLLFAEQGKYSQVLLAVVVFTKKTTKLPKQQHDLAVKRMKDWEQRSSE